MKMTRKKKLLALAALCFAFLIADAGASARQKTIAPIQRTAYGQDIPTELTQYLGYGYDVTRGKAISDPDALMLANPILDVDNPELRAYEKAFTASQTTYLSHTSKSTTEIAQQYGMTLGGGVSGKIQMVSLNISSKFNTNTSFSQKFEEEYSYFSIYAKNRTVLLQAGAETLSQYLDSRFMEAAKAITSEEDANNLYERYGTHLVTGYNLGGIFEMTNYYASKSSAYARQNTLSFSSQVEAAFGAYGAGVDFSFSQNYGSLDNNSYAVNNYKCTTYGGYTFPGLTIDQAFSYYETAFGAGYIYGLWTDSINAGKNLSIVSIPQSSEMIPLFNLLPATNEYGKARDFLIKSYIRKCGLSYRSFLEKYPNVNSTREPSQLDPLDIGYRGLGINVYELGDADNVYRSSYISSDDVTDTVLISKNSIVSFDFSESYYYGRKLEWKVSALDDPNHQISVLDSRSGVFMVPQDIPNGEYAVTLELDDAQIYTVSLKIANTKYSGGLGTEKSPYRIASKADLFAFMENEGDWNKSFILNSDIVLSPNEDYSRVKIVGYKNANGSTLPFSGNFDGNYHTITGLVIGSQSSHAQNNTYGLFGYSTGIIKNLNLGNENESGVRLANFPSNRNWTYITHNPTDADSSAKAFGLLCGVNDGTIENCSLVGTKMELYLAPDELMEFIHVGNLVGQNQNGTVADCHVEGSSIRLASSNVENMYVGGLVGSNTKEKTLRYCEARDIAITIDSTRTGRIGIHAGGIVGSTNGDIEDCLVTNSQKDSEADYPKTISGQTSSTDGNTMVDLSAVVAHIFGKTVNVSRVLVSNLKEISCNLSGGTLRKDVFVCRLDNGGGATFANCCVEQVTLENLGGKVANENTTQSGIESKSRLKWSDVESVLGEDEHWGKDGYDYVVLLKNTVTSNDISFDFSKAKKVFYLSSHFAEEFKTGEISITATSSTGDEVSVKNYQVDASNFNSHKGELGTWDIFVTALGVRAKYQVRTVSVSNIGLHVVPDSAAPLDYYAGDKFNPKGLTVQLVNQLGIDEDSSLKYKFDETITSSELANRKYYEIEDADRELIAGLNVFTISYYDVSTKTTLTSSYSVYAKESVVQSVASVHDAPQSNFVLPVGTRVINASDLVGLAIHVDLEPVMDVDSLVPETDLNHPHAFTIRFDANTLKRNKLLVEYEGENLLSREIDADEVEFIHSTIQYGPNTIHVCYNGYLLDDEATFEIEGRYVGLQDKFDEFQSIVESQYSSATTLRARFGLLQRALTLKGELNSLSNDDRYVVLCQELEILLDAYNQDVRLTNEAMIDVTRVPVGFYYNSLINNGAIAFPLLLALVFMLL